MCISGNPYPINFMKESYLIKENRHILGYVLKFSELKKIRLYIVGGFLRDIILARRENTADIDFALRKNAIKFTADLARRLKAGFVVLDKTTGCARLIKKDGKRVFTLDFSNFRGENLGQDLSRRDFSINAMAIELKIFLESFVKTNNPELLSGFLIDPYGGLKDLESGIIRVVSRLAFDDDPLRLLRAFSLSCILNFKIEPQTLNLVDKKRNRLKTVSFERIRDELFKILKSSRAYEFLTQLDQHRIIELIVPEIKAMRRINQGPYHHLNVWQHTLETVRQIEKIFKNSARNQNIMDYLNQEISSGRSRGELITLGGFIHDIGKPATLRIEDGKISFHGHERRGSEMVKKITRRLKLSNDEDFLLRRMVFLHLRPGYLANNSVLTPRAKFRFFRDAAEEAVSVLLISLADQRATCGCLATPGSRRRHERVVRRLIKDYFRKDKEKKPVRLINGDNLIKRFKLQPSPLIGRILSQVQEAQAIGRIKTKQEALKIAEGIIKKGAKKCSRLKSKKPHRKK